ncbi:hypothetical protein VNO80_02431 [Phaseolus coccineus]|uniref:Uncharacterized protein n=1 Tax=Phaseolus coccineus TaxID=3886 RepID=A0AAN9NPY6_PHACN
MTWHKSSGSNQPFHLLGHNGPYPKSLGPLSKTGSTPLDSTNRHSNILLLFFFFASTLPLLLPREQKITHSVFFSDSLSSFYLYCVYSDLAFAECKFCRIVSFTD